MNDQIAQQLLAKVMSWDNPERPDLVAANFPNLQLLATYKYDHYQQFGPGKRFIESLALWLSQFRAKDREIALQFVKDKVVYVSEAEFFHLVQIAYPDVVVPERMKLVSEETGIPLHKVQALAAHARFRELGLKSLYLGLSDGSRTSELRRGSRGEVHNEQIWQAYELGEEKSAEMLRKLSKRLTNAGFVHENQRFTLIWLIDDFSGSGNTYIRLEEHDFKGKLRRVFDTLHRDGLVDPSHYEVFLLLYVATRQAMDHIQYWCERFTSENGYKPLQVRVIQELNASVDVTQPQSAGIRELIYTPDYYDKNSETEHTKVGGTDNVRLGFANCGLPIVLSHNTPNNSIFILWAEETLNFKGLFPRVSRHRDG